MHIVHISIQNEDKEQLTCVYFMPEDEMCWSIDNANDVRVDRSIHKILLTCDMAHIWQISQLMKVAYFKPRNFSLLGLLNSSSCQKER